MVESITSKNKMSSGQKPGFAHSWTKVITNDAQTEGYDQQHEEGKRVPACVENCDDKEEDSRCFPLPMRI